MIKLNQKVIVKLYVRIKNGKIIKDVIEGIVTYKDKYSDHFEVTDNKFKLKYISNEDNIVTKRDILFYKKIIKLWESKN